MGKKVTIYIVATQTGTILSRVLKMVTKAKYNHISISLDKELENMYSFGRKYPYNPFIAGLVQENPNWGTFKRFPNTVSKIISLDIEEDQYLTIKKHIKEMYSHKDDYHYDLLGVMLGYFHIYRKREYYYYCSDFVKEVLVTGTVANDDYFPKVVKPIDILNIDNHKVIYEGLLKDYE